MYSNLLFSQSICHSGSQPISRGNRPYSIKLSHCPSNKPLHNEIYYFPDGCGPHKREKKHWTTEANHGYNHGLNCCGLAPHCSHFCTDSLGVNLPTGSEPLDLQQSPNLFLEPLSTVQKNSCRRSIIIIISRWEMHWKKSPVFSHRRTICTGKTIYTGNNYYWRRQSAAMVSSSWCLKQPEPDRWRSFLVLHLQISFQNAAAIKFPTHFTTVINQTACSHHDQWCLCNCNWHWN